MTGKGQFHEALGRGELEQAMRLFVPTIYSEPGTDDLVELSVRQILRLPAATVLNFFGDDPERDIVPLLDRVRVPTLVMHGSEERRVPFEDGRYLAEHIPGARLYPFEGRGHLPLFTATREFCELLREFIRAETAPERPAVPGVTRD